MTATGSTRNAMIIPTRVIDAVQARTQSDGIFTIHIGAPPPPKRTTYAPKYMQELKCNNQNNDQLQLIGRLTTRFGGTRGSHSVNGVNGDDDNDVDDNHQSATGASSIVTLENKMTAACVSFPYALCPIQVCNRDYQKTLVNRNDIVLPLDIIPKFRTSKTQSGSLMQRLAQQWIMKHVGRAVHVIGQLKKMNNKNYLECETHHFRIIEDISIESALRQQRIDFQHHLASLNRALCPVVPVGPEPVELATTVRAAYNTPRQLDTHMPNTTQVAVSTPVTHMISPPIKTPPIPRRPLSHMSIHTQEELIKIIGDTMEQHRSDTTTEDANMSSSTEVKSDKKKTKNSGVNERYNEGYTVPEIRCLINNSTVAESDIQQAIEFMQTNDSIYEGRLIGYWHYIA